MSEDAGDGTYDLSLLSEKTRKSNHLQMSLQRAVRSPQLFKKHPAEGWSGLGLEPKTSHTVA